MIFRKPVDIKEVKDTGMVVAVIATLNVVDKDGDVTLPGFFGEQEVVMLPCHDWGHIPLGKGRVYESGDKAVAEMKMNLDLESAREWHSALAFDLKNGRPLQQYSYGFNILSGGSSDGEKDGRKVRFLQPAPGGAPGCKVHEISPVLVGAGEGTGTLAVKGDKRQLMAECLEACKRCLEACVLCFSACQFAKMEEYAAKCLACAEACRKCIVACESKDLAAAMAACQVLVIACLECKASCEKCRALCLSGGLNDCAATCSTCAETCARCAEVCVRMAAMPGKSFSDQAKAALDSVEGLLVRAESLVELRAKEGRKPSAETQDRLKKLSDRLLSLEATLKGSANDDAAVRVELGRALRSGLK